MVSSMTAFGRKEIRESWGYLTWEIRSVNHRYLDLSFRMPDTFRELEPKLRELTKHYLHRGKVECNLRFQAGEDRGGELQPNQSLIQQLITISEKLSQDMKTLLRKKRKQKQKRKRDRKR